MEIQRAQSSVSGGLEPGDLKLLQIIHPSATSANITAQPPAAVFTKFPDLPLELRSAIWEATMLPRIIEIRPIRRSNPSWSIEEAIQNMMMNSWASSGVNDNTIEFVLRRSQDRIPAILHVSKEARKHGRKFYKPLFQGTPCAVYFNYAIDTLYIPFQPKFRYCHTIRCFFHQHRAKGLQRIRNFAYDDAFGIHAVYCDTRDNNIPLTLLQELSSLQELKVVIINSGRYKDNHRGYGLSDIGRAAAWLSKLASSDSTLPSCVGVLSSGSSDNSFYDFNLLGSYNLLKQHTKVLWHANTTSAPPNAASTLPNAALAAPNVQYLTRRYEIMVLGRNVLAPGM